MSDEELIRAFYSESATAEQIEQFNQQYQENGAFKNQADQMKLELAAFREEERAGIRSKFSSWEAEEKPTKHIQLSTYWKMSIAASIVIASFIGYQSWSDKDLYSEYYSAYPNYEYTTTRGEDEVTLRSKAFAAYDSKAYELANDLFTELISQSDQPEYHFFRGITRLETNNPESAFEDFGKLTNDGNSYYQASLWYSALAYIKLEKTDKARQLLDELAQLDEYRKEAGDLLEELD